MSFFDLGLSDLVSGVFGLGTTAINNNWQSKENETNRQHDVDMANLEFELNEQSAVNAYERSIDAWNMEQEYNTPANQRARMEEAGINPAVAFGSGVSTSAGNSSQAPQSSQGGASAHSTAGRAPQIDPQSFLLMSQARKTNAEADAIQQTTPITVDKLRNEALESGLRAQWESVSQMTRLELLGIAHSVQSLDLSSKKLDLKFNEETFDSRKGLIDSDLQKLKEQVELIAEQTKAQGIQNEYQAKQLIANIVATYAGVGTGVIDTLLGFLKLPTFKSKSK